MLIRLRTPNGQQRIEIQENISMTELADKISAALDIPVSDLIASREPAMKNPIKFSAKSCAQGGMRHGDMLYVSSRTVSSNVPVNSNASASSSHAVQQQDDLDDILDLDQGLIKRYRDPKMCKHGDKGMCDHCMPVEPFDPAYLEANKIKHVSFHAFLKKRRLDQIAKTRNDISIPVLEELNFNVKRGCTDHLPYPDGICSKCQPSAITLQQQPFRLVDHIEFDTPQLIETFIGSWRKTGAQRFGFLIGKYEQYNEVPLGIKCVVSAIYEPQQSGTADGVDVSPWPDPFLASTESMSHHLGLKNVGVIYTDLVDDGSGSGQVLCKRHAGSYFMACTEVLFSASLQGEHRNRCKHSASGFFGSKYVTVVISGNEDMHISLSAYQVSNAAVAMLEADIIEPSTNPSFMRVKDNVPKTESSQSHPARYVPEVFYRSKNEYGIDVQNAAQPTFPVEYLIVTLTHGFPANPVPFFRTPKPFPVENRPQDTNQDLCILKKSLMRGDICALAATDRVDCIELVGCVLSDFHLLLFVERLGIFSKDDFLTVLDFVRSRTGATWNTMVGTDSWKTLTSLIVSLELNSTHSTFMNSWGCESCSFQNPSSATVCQICETRRADRVQSHVSSGSTLPDARHNPGLKWKCDQCTFENIGNAISCEMCGLPK